MIQIQTLLKVADNSGGKLVRCIKILKKGAKTRYAKVGDIIVVSVQQIRAKNKLTSKVKKRRRFIWGYRSNSVSFKAFFWCFFLF